MDISNRFEVGRILINELEQAVDNLSPYDEKLVEINKRANSIKRNMIIFYERWDRPPELFEQIEIMNSVIKKLEQLHNKHVTGM